jgi:hypothetical protein
VPHLDLQVVGQEKNPACDDRSLDLGLGLPTAATPKDELQKLSKVVHRLPDLFPQDVVAEDEPEQGKQGEAGLDGMLLHEDQDPLRGGKGQR